MKRLLLFFMIIVAGCASPELTHHRGAAIEGAYAGEMLPQSVIGQSWSKYAARPQASGYHFNLNQQAKNVDSGGNQNTWYGVFRPDVPIQDGDRVYVCGPNPTVNFQIRDNQTLQTIFNGGLTGLPPCL